MVVNNKKVTLSGISEDIITERVQAKLVNYMVENHPNSKVLNIALINNNAAVLFMDGSNLIIQIANNAEISKFKSVIVMDNMSSYIIQFVN